MKQHYAFFDLLAGWEMLGLSYYVVFRITTSCLLACDRDWKSVFPITSSAQLSGQYLPLGTLSTEIEAVGLSVVKCSTE